MVQAPTPSAIRRSGFLAQLGAAVSQWVTQRRPQRRWQLTVTFMRLLLAFAFLPAGLKKILGQPFTDKALGGRFHDFLDAFHQTGFFYHAVGVLQLSAAVLLILPRLAGLGALLMAPMLVAITLFCWSTGVVPTAVVATLMLSATFALLLWELPWITRGFDPTPGTAVPSSTDRIHVGIWTVCGFAIFALYGLACLLQGEVYRPKGASGAGPWIMAAIAIAPLATWIVERKRAPRQVASKSSQDGLNDRGPA